MGLCERRKRDTQNALFNRASTRSWKPPFSEASVGIVTVNIIMVILPLVLRNT